MASGYTWKNSQYNGRSAQSNSDHLGRWIAVAILLAVISHLVVLIAMQKMPIIFGSDDGDTNISTEPVVVRSVNDVKYLPEALPDKIETSPETAEAMMEELEILEEAPEDMEIDFSPTIDEPEMSVEMSVPALMGDELSSSVDMTEGIEMTPDLEDIGSTDEFMTPEKGQIVIDPGIQNADRFDSDKFNTELAKGAGGNDINGVLDGYTPLAEMTRLSQSDLENAKGMIGSDLLYDFGKATLRDSAKNSLMKVVLIIDKNPEMKCWIEGHTDLIGTDEANYQLSLARAQEVKDWLVDSIKIEPDRLYVRGMGKSQVVVMTGDRDAQAINRRVEIKMRKKAPPQGNNINTPMIENLPERQLSVIKPKRNPNIGEELANPQKPATDIKDRPKRGAKAVPVEDPSNASEPTKAPKTVPIE